MSEDMLESARNMLGKIGSAELRLVHHLLGNLASEDSDTRRKWFWALPRFLHEEDPWKGASPIELVGRTDISVTPEFTASIYFPREARVNCEGVPFEYISDGFFDLLDRSKWASFVPATTLRVHHQFKENFSDVFPVATALGGDELLVVEPCHMYKMIKASSNDRRGLMHKQGHYGFCLADPDTSERLFVRVYNAVYRWHVETPRPFTRFEDEVNGCRMIVTR
ncbi:MAG: hypothetical protein Q7S80_02935 [bacterium]|nr:hypothetical protein [bacterium]